MSIESRCEMSTETEAAFDEAVERMARVDHHVFLTAISYRGWRCECGAIFHDDRRAALAHERAEMLRALLSDSVPCETCGGTGKALHHIVGQERTRLFGRCADCDGSGQVSRPSLAVLRADLMQEGEYSAAYGIVNLGGDGWGWDYNDGWRLGDHTVPLYRDASGEVAP